jgi:membrane dipeptidase
LTCPDEVFGTRNVAGLENRIENFFNIVGWLVKHGYTAEEIQAVTGGNVMRVLERVWV